MNEHVAFDASPDQEDVRDGLQREMTRRWTATAREVRRAILLHDALGIGDKAPHLAMPVSDKAEMFRRWLNERLAIGIGGYDGSWLGPFVRRASERGAGAALGDAQANVAFLLPSGPAPSSKACHGASVASLANICGDVSDKAHESVARGLLVKARPRQIARLVDSAMGHGLRRSRALAEHAVTQAYSQATLDAMAARGVTHVGTVSERKRLRDAFDPDEPRDEAGKWVAEAVHEDPDIATIRDVIKNDLGHGGRFVILKSGKVLFGGGYKNTHASLAPFSERTADGYIETPDALGRKQPQYGLTEPDRRGSIVPLDKARSIPFIKMLEKAGIKPSVGMRDADEDDEETIIQRPDGTLVKVVRHGDGWAVIAIDAFDPDEPRNQLGEWTASGDGTISGKDGRQYDVKHSLGVNNEHTYTVSHEGRYVGEARLSHTGKYVVDLGVAAEHRRNGVATALYNHIENHLGYKLEPSPVYRTEAGEAFWASRKLGDEEVWDAPRKTPQPKHPRSGKFAKAHVVAREMRRSKRTGQFRKQGLAAEEQRREELAEARFGRVKGKLDVLTAGDDRVCDICDEISDNGPYTIGKARSLIPAHPNCRCGFVAAGTMQDAFDPDEPRDERGRWSESGKAKELVATPPEGEVFYKRPDVTTPEGAWALEVEKRVLRQADADGYPARHIEVLPYPNANVLAGANYNTLAFYEPDTGKIKFFADAMPKEAYVGTANTVEGTASHEIMHAKTDWWLKQNPSIERKLKDGLRYGGGDWDKPLGRGFATPRQLLEDDGVTPYSTRTWDDWLNSQDPSKDRGGLPFDLPFGETISEMRAVQRETGRTPGSDAWRDIYDAIEAEWEHGHSKDLVGSELNPRVRPDPTPAEIRKPILRVQ